MESSSGMGVGALNANPGTGTFLARGCLEAAGITLLPPFLPHYSWRALTRLKMGFEGFPFFCSFLYNIQEEKRELAVSRLHAHMTSQ